MTAKNWRSRSFRVDEDLWQRFSTAVEHANPDLRCSDGLRALMRWYVNDVDRLPIALPDYLTSTHQEGY